MKIFVSTLEPSGDALCTDLVQELLQLQPEIEFFGLGGPKMELAGVKLIESPLTQLSALGVINNLLTVPKYLMAMKKALNWIKENHPEKVIVCDSRFFNLKLAEQLRKQGYNGSIIYYIAPVTWQSLYDQKYLSDEKHLKRFMAIKQYCDYAVLAYPVSLEIYQKLEIKHYFFGHPLSNKCKPTLTKDEFYTRFKINPAKKLISLFPGIRPSEYKLIAPILRKVSIELVDKGFTVTCDVDLSDQQENIIIVPPELHFDLIAFSDLVISKSGTVVQECTLLKKPVVCVYKIPDWQAWFARKILHFSMPFYSLPNLLAGMMIIPELFQEDFTTSKVVEKALELLDNSELYQRTIERLDRVRATIIGDDPVKAAAMLILE